MIADRFFFGGVASAAEDSGRVLESGFQCDRIIIIYLFFEEN